MSLDNTWQEIRDHSFIQNHSRSFRLPAPWRCFFSSVHLTHLLQGSGQRTGMAKAEDWFCAQWPIFVLFLRFVFGILYGWKIQTWPIIIFLKESVTYLFFICWYLIESMMPCLNKMSRTSSRNIGQQHQKYSRYFFLKPSQTTCGDVWLFMYLYIFFFLTLIHYF